MHIIWYGQSCFQIVVARNKGEQVKIIINPLRKIEADIAIAPQGANQTPGAFLIDGPGEYEIKEVFIQGIALNPNQTIYTIEAEQMRLCHLDELAEKELSNQILEEIGDVDILLMPASASKVISQIEPRIAIPMNYDKVDKFLKEMGKKSAETLPKLLIKKKDLPEETKIIVLKP